MTTRSIIIAAALALSACSSDETTHAESDTPVSEKRVPGAVRMYETQNGYAYVDRFCDGQTAVYIATYYYKSTALSTVPNSKECSR